MPTFREFMRIADITIKDKTSSKRMGEIFSILKKHDATHGIPPEKAVAILEDLGPTYVKMGQIASNRSDLLPKSYCDAFEKLRANVPPIPFETVIGIIERAYDKPWGEVFATIDEKPLGSASIAQVHKATLLDGTVVAVKVRRPGIVEQMAEDIMLMKHILAIAAFSTTAHENMVLTLDGFVAELERTTASELDFTVELSNLVQFYTDMERQEGVSSPLPYPQYTTDDVLVMEFVTGFSISEVERLKAEGVDPGQLGTRLVQSYVTQVVDNGFFHADPHPGNIIMRDGDIVWIDLGMTGRLTQGERALVNKAFLGIATQDAFALKEALLGLTKAKGPIDHGLLVSQIDTLLSQYCGDNLEELDVGMALLDIIEMLRQQNLVVSPSVTMLARGFLTLEGVVASLAPDVSVAGVISEHVERQLGNPESVTRRVKQLASSALDSTQAAARLPVQLSNALSMLTRGQVKVSADLDVPQDVVAQFTNMVGNMSLAMIATGLFIGSSVLCTTNMEPRVFEVPIIGILGYIGAFVLSAYVTVRLLAERHKEKNG